MTVYLCEFLGRRFGSCGLAYSVQSKLNAEGIERSVELKTRIGFNLIFCLDYLAMAQDVFGVERCSTVYWIALLGLYPVVAVSVLMAMRFMQELAAWHESRHDPPVEGEPDLGRAGLTLVPLLAMAVGLLAGLLGLGGGEFMVPLLLELGLAARVAAATSGFLIFFNTSSNAIHYLIGDTIQPFLDYGIPCFIFAMLGSLCGLLAGNTHYVRTHSYIIIFLVAFALFASAILLMLRGFAEVDWAFGGASGSTPVTEEKERRFKYRHLDQFVSDDRELKMAAREQDVKDNLQKWARFLRQTRPLREKYGSQLLGTDHATNVVMDEKQRQFFEAKDFCATLAREALAARAVQVESDGPSRRLRLELDEAISPLADGDEVLAPDKEHVLHLGILVDEHQLELPKFYRVVQFRGKAMALPEGRLVPWKGYAERLAHGTEEGNTLCCSHSWSVWRCEIWTEGLFSLLFWALGFLESSVGRAEERFLIDWTDERILFHGSGQLGYSSNAWNHFFEQPGGDPPKLKEKLGECQEAGRLKIVVRFGPPWFQKFGEFRGADEGDGPFREIKGGRLDEATAELGRQAVRRWVRVRPAILHRAEEWLNEHSEGGRRLAVHLRRTDKLEQCRPYLESEDHFLNSFVCRCREAIKAQTNGAEAHDALDHLALGLASEERLAYGAFARFDKNRNHFLQGIEIEYMLDYLGFPHQQEDVQRFVAAVDKLETDGKISPDEFLKVVGSFGGCCKLFEMRRKQIEARGTELEVPEDVKESDLRCQLLSCGILDDELATWKPVVSSADMKATASLQPCQMEALQHVRNLARINHEKALPELTEKFQSMGYNVQDMWMTLAWIRELAPIIIHINLPAIGDFLARDSHYRNQFETQNSGGLLDLNVRNSWEGSLFGRAYEVGVCRRLLF
ncbi:unnamed protein product [Durusdinium trenchii]|uniref:EF-hand domain-containing protein n=1 Tax=Durusdinium trenchii TaxID=1381693 RepID=A0ABP0NG86_9DINO